MPCCNTLCNSLLDTVQKRELILLLSAVRTLPCLTLCLDLLSLPLHHSTKLPKLSHCGHFPNFVGLPYQQTLQIYIIHRRVKIIHKYHNKKTYSYKHVSLIFFFLFIFFSYPFLLRIFMDDLSKCFHHYLHVFFVPTAGQYVLTEVFVLLMQEQLSLLQHKRHLSLGIGRVFKWE